MELEENHPDTNEQVYRIIKCPLKCVLKRYDMIHPILEQSVIELNDIVILSYQFIRLFLLDKFNNQNELPKINKQFVLDVMKTVSYPSGKRGIKTKEENIKNVSGKTDIKYFYRENFSELVSNKPSYGNKTHILALSATEIITCIKTNISTHFVKHLFKYINCLFKYPKSIEIKKERNKATRKIMYQELNKEIRDLKHDLINNKIENSKLEYHTWILENKHLLYPSKLNKSVAYDVKVNPDKYIKYSFYINQQIETLGYKPYQVIPQRNNITPKHITINTPAIVDLIDDKKQKIFNYNKSELVLHAKKHQSHIWSKLLKLEKKHIFKQKDYVFYNQIITDGFSCSLLFIMKKYKNKKYGEVLPSVNQETNFPKLVNLSTDECNEYLTDKYKLVSLDPGKIRPISMIDENNIFFKYTACRRRYETYTKRSNYVINQEKQKYNIIPKETILSKFNSKSLNQTNYKNFIINKTIVNDEIKDFYQKPLFRKLAFRRFVRTKQSEINLLNEIENKYLTKQDKIDGKKIVILHGDYSRTTQMKGTIPTPNIGIKKLLLSRFKILEVNEFNTSKLYNKTLKEMENVKIKRKKHSKHLHEILTPKEETECRIFVNRDVNACKNILLLGKCFLTNQTRPDEFKQKKERLVV
jgi:hypothetical protein|uniref:Uncharacterized protein n=1 Tax=viral metagenome TaxID=1070528 RepID=A0A6C0IRX9_9ZZZZ